MGQNSGWASDTSLQPRVPVMHRVRVHQTRVKPLVNIDVGVMVTVAGHNIRVVRSACTGKRYKSQATVMSRRGNVTKRILAPQANSRAFAWCK